MKTSKKILIIGGIILDVGLTAYLLIVAIIMLATMPHPGFEPTNPSNMIEYFQANPWVYFGVNVVPLFLLLTFNIAVLVWYVKKTGQKKAVEMSDLDETQKEALKAELLKELSQGSKEDKE